MADSDSGFVYDELSGLYFHASAGFYHDPSAGWYYNTNDGVYYMYENGEYVPLGTTSSASVEDDLPQNPQVVDSAICASPDENTSPRNVLSSSHDVEEGECILQDDSRSTVVEPHKRNIEDVIGDSQTDQEAECTLLDESGPAADVESPRRSFEQVICEFETDKVGLVEDDYPLWHFDALRSIYWYYDKESRAYYMYDGHCESSLAERADAGTISGVALIPEQGLENGGRDEVDHDDDQRGMESEDFQPTSGWVEETLIDLYLKGYKQETGSTDDGPWITSADIFDDIPRNPDCRTVQQEGGRGIQNGSFKNGLLKHSLQDEEIQLAGNVSDDDGSEELEEGEWVPDEPLSIVDDGEEECLVYDMDGDQGAATLETRGTVSSRRVSTKYWCISEECNDLGQEHEKTRLETESGSNPGSSLVEEGEISLVDEQREEERWHAQYGQVVREKSRNVFVPGTIDLWDWTIIDKESKSSKLGKHKKQLVGRIAASSKKLHPSLSGSSGLIRSSAITAAELDFVKVSSGKIYRLRRVSKKHLASVGTYDSADPTKGFGFPAIGLFAVESGDGYEPDAKLSGPDQSHSRSEPLLSKPFVPNIGHWRFQHLIPTKKSKNIPNAILKSRYLSAEEIALNEQRKRKYRDRVEERRCLHGGFGVGPGQKQLSALEEDKLDADEAAGMVGALAKAAAAPSIGGENVGKRMLESMGWKEGQSIGLEGGLVRPLQAQGNIGRAGLGWASAEL